MVIKGRGSCYKTMLQQVKDNGVISEEALKLAAKLALEDREVYFVKRIVQEGPIFGWVICVCRYITFGWVYVTRWQFL